MSLFTQKPLRRNQVLCNSIACDEKPGIFRCENCGIVYYCSNQCRKFESVTHKMVCYKSLPARIKGFIRAKLDYPAQLDVPNISMRFGVIYISNVYHPVSVFGTYDDGYNCAICGQKRDSSDDEIMAHYIAYYRCEECEEKDRRLCFETFHIKGDPCFRSNLEKIFILRTTGLVTEDVIASFFITLQECGCHSKRKMIS